MVCFINSRRKKNTTVFLPATQGFCNSTWAWAAKHTHTHLLTCLRLDYLCMQYPGNHSIKEVRHHLASPTAETDPNPHMHTGVKDKARYNIMLNQSENYLKLTIQVAVSDTPEGFTFWCQRCTNMMIALEGKQRLQYICMYKDLHWKKKWCRT